MNDIAKKEDNKSNRYIMPIKTPSYDIKPPPSLL